MERYLHAALIEDLRKKMVFLGGPRQVGKTTLARSLPEASLGYLNWDIPKDRARILKRVLPDAPLLIFDEVHKYRAWRNYLKGVFDEFHPEKRILVTGSARLDLYRYGGDSLQGRYYYLRLHPLSFKEIGGKSRGDLDTLLTLGGFPEPFLDGSLARARRWGISYRERLLREDIASLESIKDLGSLELLLLSLPDRVSSPLSVNSLREDLSLNHKTVSRWLDVLERMYAIFRIAPFGAPRIRAVKKEQKHYLFNWAQVRDEGARFENLVASHLLKWTHYLFDTEGRSVELRYFRDIDKREVDFVIVEDGEPIIFVECKVSDTTVSPSLRYLHERFPQVRSLQVVRDCSEPLAVSKTLSVMPATMFLSELV
jgi:uncharacterized protein